MTKTILILSLLFLAGCADWGNGGCYWEKKKRKDILHCYNSYRGWEVRKEVYHQKHRRHKHGRKHKH